MATCLVGEIRKCWDCGREIGTNKAGRCNTCHSYICPYCDRCLCDNEARSEVKKDIYKFNRYLSLLW